MGQPVQIALMLALAGFIFMCIALPTYLLGCNANISETCLAYDTFSGTIYKREVEQQWCKGRCLRKNSDGHCVQYDYYLCYDSYVWAHKGPHNSTVCYLQVASNYRSKQSAEAETYDYYISEHVDWLRTKGSSECITNETAYTYWLVGIIFFSLMGAVWLAAVCCVGAEKLPELL